MAIVEPDRSRISRLICSAADTVDQRQRIRRQVTPRQAHAGPASTTPRRRRRKWRFAA
jgi:hypothetical protein